MEPIDYRTQVFTVTAAAHVLDDHDNLSTCVERLIDAGGFTPLKTASHVFEPSGVTLVALLAESHIAIHTWPDHSTAKIVISTCRKDPVDADTFERIMTDQLAASNVSWTEVMS